jgi:hypothetical protein
VHEFGNDLLHAGMFDERCTRVQDDTTTWRRAHACFYACRYTGDYEGKLCSLVFSLLHTLQAIDPSELMAMNCEILLNNTYHLGHRPGADTVAAAGVLWLNEL